MKFSWFLASSLLFLGQAHASVRIGDWLRTELGTPLANPQGPKTPAELCQDLGARLPSPRELAEWAARSCTQTLQTECGAKGIRETQFRDVDAQDPRVREENLSMWKQGFREVLYNKEGQYNTDYIEFYFNGDGYIPPAPERMAPSTILSSASRRPGNYTQFVIEPNYDDYFVYGFNQDGDHLREGGVRCAFDN